MAVYDQSYAPWAGSYTGRSARVAAMVRIGLRHSLRNLWTLLTLIPTFALAFGWMMILLALSTVVQKFAPAEELAKNLSAVGNNVYRVWFFNVLGFIILLGLIAVGAGSGLISRDIKHNALLMYFSRAITRGDYILAKFLVLVIILLTATLGPGIILWLGQMGMGIEKVTTGDLLGDLAAVALHSLILSIPLAAAVLAASSVTKHGYVAGILLATVFFGGEMFSRLLTGPLKEPWGGLLSYQKLTAHLADYCYPLRYFNGDPEKPIRPPDPALETGWLEPLLILGAITAISLAVVRWRLRSTEVSE